MNIRLLLLLVLFALPGFTFSQDKNQIGSQKKDALHVYFKLSAEEISMDYIRTEIPLIEYVRDPDDADVYIIITSQEAGNRGEEFNFYIIGQNDFKGRSDTLIYTSSPDDTESKILKRICPG